MAVESADEFYCIMGVLTREILEFGLMDANMFVKVLSLFLFFTLYLICYCIVYGLYFYFYLLLKNMNK